MKCLKTGEKQIFEILNSHSGLKGKMKGDEIAVTVAHVIWLSLVFQVGVNPKLCREPVVTVI